jgi:DNA-binding SARP family transcriptional activator
MDAITNQRGARLRLTREFELVVAGRSIAVPHSVQRLLAFLAVAKGPLPRSRVAGQLWLDVPEWRALGNLRSALWRLRLIPPQVVRALDDRIGLAPEVHVDLAELQDVSARLIDGRRPPGWEQVSSLLMAHDLLPGWEEEWLYVERERFHELRLRALERACESLIDREDYPRAAQVVMAAIEAEPFRESTRRMLIRLYLQEGNRAEAVRSYRAFRDLMAEELGMEPSDQIRELVADLSPDRRTGNGAVTEA